MWSHCVKKMKMYLAALFIDSGRILVLYQIVKHVLTWFRDHEYHEHIMNIISKKWLAQIGQYYYKFYFKINRNYVQEKNISCRLCSQLSCFEVISTMNTSCYPSLQKICIWYNWKIGSSDEICKPQIFVRQWTFLCK